MSAPTSPWLPTRSAVCPACGTAFSLPATGRCGACDVDLTHPAVARYLELEHDRWLLLHEQAELLATLVATRLGALPPSPWDEVADDASVPTAEARPGTDGASSAAPAWERSVAAAERGRSRVDARLRHLSVPTILALSGVALLTAAAVVFTAVTWETLPPWAQAAILLAATVVAGAAAFALSRRGIPTAAAALGVVAMSFAAVDVLALDRGGLVDLDVFVLPAAAALAAVVGWWLARHELRWVAVVGAAAAAVTAGSLVVAVADRYDLTPLTLALVALGCSVVLAGTTASWTTRPARLVAGVGAVLGATAAGIAAGSALAASETTLPAGLGVLGLAVVLLMAASRVEVLTLAPASLLVTGAGVATALHLGAEDLDVLAAAGAVVVALAWLTTRLATDRQLPVVLGLFPAGLALAMATVHTLDPFTERLVSAVVRDPVELLDPWGAVVVVLAGAALLALPRARAGVAWVVAGVVVLASAALTVEVAWPLLTALAGGAALTVPATVRPVDAEPAPPAWSRTDALVPLLLATVATGWVAGTPWMLAVAAAVTAGFGAWIARRTEYHRRSDLRCTVAEVVGTGASALAVWAAAGAVGIVPDVALGASLVVVFALVVAVRQLREEDPPIAGSLVALVATVLLPAGATTFRAAGVLLLVAGTGWLVLAVVGWSHARWVNAAVLSAGVAVLLADADVRVVEAYTLVPALTLGAAGLWSLREDRELRTIVALTPSLAVGLVPSLVVLAGEPEALARTVGLVVVAGALAAVGTRLRWSAPTVAGAAAAVVVALTQLSMVVEVLPRWVSFAAVGVLLVYLAATYERQRTRARSLTGRLRDLR